MDWFILVSLSSFKHNLFERAAHLSNCWNLIAQRGDVDEPMHEFFSELRTPSMDVAQSAQQEQVGMVLLDQAQEEAPVHVDMDHIFMMNPWLQVPSPEASGTTGISNQTPSLFRYSSWGGLTIPYPHIPTYAATTQAVPIDSQLFASNCEDIFGQRDNFLTPESCQSEASEEGPYSGQHPLPSQTPGINWMLQYGPYGDKTNELLPFTVDGDEIEALPYGDLEPLPLRPFQQVTTSRSGIRVQFMGPEEIGLGSMSLQQRTNSRQQQPPAILSETDFATLEEDVVEIVEVSTSASHGAGSERVTFNSIEEALASIESQTLEESAVQPTDHIKQQQSQQQQQQQLPERSSVHYSPPSTPVVGVPRVPVATPSLIVADEKQEEVIKAAKSLFSKRTRTLYHWLYPETSKTKLKASVSAAWDTLADAEKQFYLSQVLGRFGLQASSLMINPQLDGIKGLPPVPSPPALAAATARTASSSNLLHPQQRVLSQYQHNHQVSEAQRAVDQLFASCEDSETWTSFDINPPCPYPDASSAQGSSTSFAAPNHNCGPIRQPKTRAVLRQTERKKRRVRSKLGMPDVDQLDEEVTY